RSAPPPPERGAAASLAAGAGAAARAGCLVFGVAVDVGVGGCETGFFAGAGRAAACGGFGAGAGGLGTFVAAAFFVVAGFAVAGFAAAVFVAGVGAARLAVDAAFWAGFWGVARAGARPLAGAGRLPLVDALAAGGTG